MYDSRIIVVQMSRAPCQSVPLSENRLGMGQNGRHSTSCDSSTNDMVPTVKACIICQVK